MSHSTWGDSISRLLLMTFDIVKPRTTKPSRDPVISVG